MNIKRLISVTVCGLLLALSLSAEDELMSIRFSVVGLGNALPKDCFYMAKEGEAVALGDIAPNYRTVTFEYQGPANFRLYRKGDTGAFVVYAEVTLPEASPELLFVLIPNGAEQGKLLVYDDSRAGFPAGAYRFINTTPHRIAGIVGDSKLLLNSGDAGLVELRLEANAYFSVDLRSEQNDVWNPGFSSRWRHRPSTRIVMFLYTDPSRPTSILAQTIPQHFRP